MRKHHYALARSIIHVGRVVAIMIACVRQYLFHFNSIFLMLNKESTNDHIDLRRASMELAIADVACAHDGGVALLMS